MKLPKIESVVYPVVLPYSEQNIKIKPYTVGDEIKFITAISTNETGTILANFFELVKSCVVDDIDIDSLKLVDLFYILIFVRAKSTGEILDIEKTCKNVECGHKESYQLDIIKAIDVVNSTNRKIVAEVTKKLQLELTPVNATILDTIYTNGNVELDTISSSITKVIMNDTIYSTFTKEELLDNILSGLTRPQLKTIIDKMTDLISIRLKFDATCSACGEQSTYIIEELFDFLS